LKLEKVKSLLGLEIDFDKLANNLGSREVAYIEKLKGALEENERLKMTVKEEEYRREEQEMLVEQKVIEYNDLKKKMTGEIFSLKHNMKKEKDNWNNEKFKEDDKYNQ